MTAKLVDLCAKRLVLVLELANARRWRGQRSHLIWRERKNGLEFCDSLFKLEGWS
jgi:hypothetical protein